MRRVSGRFAEVNSRARALIEAGDLAGARRLLHDALAGGDVEGRTASDAEAAGVAPDLIEAAGRYARLLVALGEPQGARRWAAFAHTAARDRYGPDDARTLAMAATLAAVLHRVGSDARAAHLYRDLASRLSIRHGPDSAEALAARADLATVLYTRGECVRARVLLAQAWAAHRASFGEGHPAGIKMLALLGGMERDCAVILDAHEHLAQAGALCRIHLPADHPLSAQVAALAEAPANRDHRCRDGRRVPRQASPVDAGAPPGAPWSGPPDRC